ncbi:MAG: DUF202 domain-containing protein [Bacteroidota bacterium]
MSLLRPSSQTHVDKHTNEEESTLRDFLALERTRMANERTLLSYLRTSLYLIVGGIAFLQVERLDTVHWLGYVCFALSIIALIVGISRFIQLRRTITRCYTPPER